MNKQHLVILGGGFAGLHTYTSLPQSVKKQSTITIIDKNNHFLFTPLLPEVAGSSLHPHNIALPIKDVLGKEAKFIQDSVESVNVREKTVRLSDGQNLKYDMLVSALGANTFFYGTPGAEEHALTFKSLEDAKALRNRCIDIFQEASELESQEERQKLLSFIIIGAGPTGVEVVTEIAELIFGTLSSKYKNISLEDISITLINSGDRVLQMFDEKLSHYAQKSLSKEHIQLLNNIRVTEIKKDSVMTNDGNEIFANTILWTAGVSAIDLNCACGTFKKERGRIHVQKDLSLEDYEHTFILGDMALYPTEDGRGLPMTAQVARQQGIHTAKNIARILKGQSTEVFVYKEKGLLASLGSFNAIGQIKGIHFKGASAWIMWRAVYLMLFNSWKKRFEIMGIWFKNLFSKRDITRFQK
ncbi:MAG: NAD(P)/FAD-dependent oxidoreductase [Candidatus Pacebacteria bacterium]|nr:NAD(P)/FAD-dependent oxidoreductase [Candidatus Paceibacterota bacterium]